MRSLGKKLSSIPVTTSSANVEWALPYAKNTKIKEVHHNL
jgi:hypothetical protein